MRSNLLLMTLVVLLCLPASVLPSAADQNMELVSQTTGVVATALAVRDKTVAVNYVVPPPAGGRLRFYDVTNPAAPLSRGDSSFSVTTSGPMCFDNQKLYMAGLVDPGIGVLMTIDTNGPDEPELVGVCPLWDWDWRGGLAVSNNLAYMWVDSGLSVFDVTDPTSITPRGSCTTSFSPYDAKIALSQDRAYVSWRVNTNNEFRLLVFDRTEPTSLTLFTAYNVAKGNDFAVAGNLVYLLDAETTLKILDFTDPTDPVLVGSLPHSGGIIRVSNGLAYILSGTTPTLLEVIDVRNASAPTLRGSLALPSADFYDFVAVGKHAYLAAWQAGLLIVRYTGADVSSAHCWALY